MVVGVDDAAAAAGFLSLTVTLVAGCMKGFVILSDALRCGTDTFIVECLLQVEHHRFVTWAEEVGLLDEPPRLPFEQKIVKQIYDLLAALEILFSDVQNLKGRFKLNLLETSDELTQLQQPSSIWATTMCREQPALQKHIAKAFRQRNNAWKRLRWVVVDVERARNLIKTITTTIDALESFLSHEQSQRLASSIEGMMRLLVVLTTDVRDLKAIVQREQDRSGDGAIAATAQCKREGISLGVLRRSDSDASTLAVSVSSVSLHDQKPEIGISQAIRLTQDLVKVDASLHPLQHRTLAFYDGKLSLIEWKPPTVKKVANIGYRIERIAAFLNGLSHPSFHTLQCRGYFWDHNFHRYAYVFELPREVPTGDLAVASEPYGVQLYTLKEQLRRTISTPSLNERIRLAICLVETVLQLHTSGFVHKEIRSDNVLFFRAKSSSAPPSANAFGPYLGGYVYARADNPLEATESPETVFEANLYRHPLTLAKDRPAYRKTFDLFSLGCVLLELGLWSRLSRILSVDLEHVEHFEQRAESPMQSTAQTRSKLKHRMILDTKQALCDPKGSSYFAQRLQASAGVLYADVTMTCLLADTARLRNNPEHDDHFSDNSLEIQETSLETLRSIVV